MNRTLVPSPCQSQSAVYNSGYSSGVHLHINSYDLAKKHSIYANDSMAVNGSAGQVQMSLLRRHL